LWRDWLRKNYRELVGKGGNALRFATREEAGPQLLDITMRWTSVRDTRVVQTTIP
jgi:hypothetical protein